MEQSLCPRPCIVFLLILTSPCSPNECLLVFGHSRVPPTGCDTCDQVLVISNLLHYSMVMNGPVCVWLLVCAAVLILPLHLHFSGVNVINQFVCETLSLLKLTCSDTSFNKLMILITDIFTLLLPFGFVLLSYVQIVTAVLKIHSVQGRLKAFTTCDSHLTV